MALSFNCGQYEQAFNSKRLQNWEERNVHRRRPATKEGYTQILATNKGHLLPSVPRSARSPWGTFVGTWDLPKSIPGNKQFDPTARSADAHFRQLSAKKEADTAIYGKKKFRRAQAGQPVEGMPADCNSEPLTRSGAANPQVKGTPNRAEPKTQSPYLSAAQPAVQDTIPQELVYPYSSQPLHSSPMMEGRITPAQQISARATPKRISPTKTASARGSQMRYSPARLSPVDHRKSPSLAPISPSRQLPLTPNISAPKSATPPRVASQQEQTAQQEEAPIPVV